jgi:hypothetical protein
MRKWVRIFSLIGINIFFFACQNPSAPKIADSESKDSVNRKAGEIVDLPAPFSSKSVSNFCTVIDWPANKTPVAPPGFDVKLFADSLDNPRWIYFA